MSEHNANVEISGQHTQGLVDLGWPLPYAKQGVLVHEVSRQHGKSSDKETRGKRHEKK